MTFNEKSPSTPRIWSVHRHNHKALSWGAHQPIKTSSHELTSFFRSCTRSQELRSVAQSSMNPFFSVKAPRVCLLMLLTMGCHSSVHASCDIFSIKLNQINANEKESLKKMRKSYVRQKCGSQAQSWIGGAAGARRFSYLNCKLSARNSEAFKSQWAVEASQWQEKREQLQLEFMSPECSEERNLFKRSPFDN